jgi:GNAT superfamily N-acetyltransferase
MPIKVAPFQNEHLAQAAELLAWRHRRDRQSIPELPLRFEDSLTTAKAIEAALQRTHARGFAALHDGRLAAYLIGDMLIDNLWGRSGWVRTAGWAYDPDMGIEAVRDLYAALGAHWVDYGIFFHFALVPVSDPALIHAWFSLSFGIEQIHALVDLAAIDPDSPTIPPGIDIRKAGPEDRGRLAEMSDVIWKTQVKSPVWGVMMPETIRENEEGWAELVDEADTAVWLAFVEGKSVAVQGYWPAEQADDNLLIPENCVRMSAAGTREGARGKGISTVLTKHGLAQARAAGYRFCETDWRSTNLLTSRFWPRLGFRPAVYRLVRRIDARIAWARGDVSQAAPPDSARNAATGHFSNTVI